VHNACVRQLAAAGLGAAGAVDPLRVKRLSVRFNRPVLMGDVLTIDARGQKRGPWNIRVTNQSGVVVLKNGVAEVA
jgi:acyl dehydratase